MHFCIVSVKVLNRYEKFIKRASGRLEEQYGHSFIFREFVGENGL